MALALIAVASPRVFACGEEADKAKSASNSACGAHEVDAAKNVVAQPGAKTGDVTKCPVDADLFTVASNSPRVKASKSTYVVCCKGCAVAFKKDPKRYTNKA
jgi:hypothetical protein